MGSRTFVEDFKQGLKFTPVAGHPNVYAIHPCRADGQRGTPEMSAAEWKKFERDISGAFEQVP